MSPEELRSKLSQLNRMLLVRDCTVWFVCVFEIAWFAYIFVIVPQLVVKVSAVLVTFGMAFLNAQVWLDQRNRRKSRERAEASGNLHSLDFLRSELQRQCQFHRGAWFWSRVAVLFPGLLIFGIAAMIVFPWPDRLVGVCITTVTVILLPVAVWLNLTKSRSYQRQIVALDALRLPPG